MLAGKARMFTVFGRCRAAHRQFAAVAEVLDERFHDIGHELGLEPRYRGFDERVGDFTEMADECLGVDDKPWRHRKTGAQHGAEMGGLAADTIYVGQSDFR